METLRAPLTLAVVLLLSACSATGASAGKEDDGKSVQAEKEVKAAKKGRAVVAARRKLEQARLEQEGEAQKRAAAVEQAARELGLADSALDDFVANEWPLKLRKAELGLKATEDELTEHLEEFEQLKLMYAEQDLADRTREMVIHRTQRRIEQSQQELELARAELAHLKEDEFATEKAKLELEVSEKQHAAEAAKIDARVSASDKAIELLEAEHALADAEADASAPAADADEESEGDED